MYIDVRTSDGVVDLGHLVVKGQRGLSGQESGNLGQSGNPGVVLLEDWVLVEELAFPDELEKFNGFVAVEVDPGELLTGKIRLALHPCDELVEASLSISLDLLCIAMPVAAHGDLAESQRVEDGVDHVRSGCDLGVGAEGCGF